MSRKLKFGIIGFGKIGPRHGEKIEENKHCKLIAVCDTDESKLRNIGDRHAELYDDHRKMLGNQEIDVVSICAPNHLHAQMTIDALNAGKHVLCEKPMALTSNDCRNMIEASINNDKRLFVTMQNRYNPPVQIVRNLLDEGELGKIYSIVVNCYWNRTREYYAQSSWRGRKEQDGGALFTQFSHFVDLMCWFGGDVKSVYAVAHNFSHPEIEIEDTGAVVVRFADGALGAINFTNCAYKKNMEGSIVLLGEKGTVKIGGQYLNTLEYQNVKDHNIASVSRDGCANDYGFYEGSMSNHHKVYENVVDTLLNNAEPDVDGREGMQSTRVIEAIYMSDAEEREIAI